MSHAEAVEWAEARGLEYVECSARDGVGVEEAVHALVSAQLRSAGSAAELGPGEPQQRDGRQPSEAGSSSSEAGSKCAVQ